MSRDAEFESQKKAAIEVLTSQELGRICEMAIWRENGSEDVYAAGNSLGTVRFRRIPQGERFSYEVVDVEGENILERQDPSVFSPLSEELANLYPDPASNHYPNAYETISQIFDDENSPDIAAVHTAAHNWEDEGGHRGEHGSLDVVQARAPFIAGGKGIAKLGVLPRSARLVDIAPTILKLIGAEPIEGRTETGVKAQGLYLRVQDGEPIDDLIEPDSPPSHVVTFLLDGCNPNVLLDMIERGEVPNIARIAESGTVFRYGAMAGFPTVTLANHTAIVTGAYPGRHSVLHNSFWHRSEKKRVDTNHPSTWHLWSNWVSDEVDTIHQAIHRSFPDAFTAAINEPADGGSDFSTFGLMRKGEWRGLPDIPQELPHSSEQFVRPYKDYEWATLADYLGIELATGVWGGHVQGRDYPKPLFMWCNFALTDAAMHRGGPHSDIARAGVRDTDGRIGEILEAIEKAGVLDDTAFFLFADHGMEETNPEVTGNWSRNLKAEGISFRDEGYGFIYIGVE
jgi:phosphonoacetate hydrolase